MRFTLEKERNQKKILAEAFQIVSNENAEMRSVVNQNGFGYFNAGNRFMSYGRQNPFGQMW